MTLSWYPKDEMTQTLLLDFFLHFARMEYVLKNHGFSRQQSGRIKPNWKKYENWLRQSGQPMPDSLKEPIEYLRDNPPKKQKDLNQWQPINSSGDWTELAISSLTTVRNNLFHGGKTPFDPVRDTTLIQHCLTLIQELILMGPAELRQTFQEAC